MSSDLPEAGFDSRQLRDLFDTACEFEGSERESFLDRACAGQPALRAALETLLRADQGTGVDRLWRSPAALVEARHMAAEASLPFECLGDYRILSRIGMGGMGAVYLAERDYDGVRRQVAIKIIPRALLDDEMLWRFHRERQILARLEHPNIAGMLDAGRTPDGMPYLAMDFVDGVPLDRYAASHQLDLKARLALFQAICSAVSYAHRNLVVHRDLKPQNILVTAEGVPKLLDFGIAKMMSAADLDAEAPATKTLLAMTPDYASPEQVRGKPITVGSDIYSLGVILYESLAGRKPYSLASRSLEEVVRAVCEEDPAPPSSFNRALAGDLDAIIRKAMRKDAEQRYASVEEFSRDLARFENREPVSASGLSFAYLARKYVARHRSQAAAILAAAFLFAAGVAGVAVEAHIANRERAKAQRRFDDLRRFANDVVFGTNENLSKLPGTTEARKALVGRGLEYLDALSRESGGDPGLEREVGAAYVRMGDIQGSRAEANIGDRDGALASYLKARTALSSAVAGSPGDLEARLGLIGVNEQLSLFYSAGGNQAESQRAVEEAVRAAEAAARSNPTDQRARKALGGAYFYMALHESDLKRPASRGAHFLKSDDHAVETWRKCLGLYLSFLQAKPRAPDALRNVALVHKNLADDLADLDHALEHAVQAEQLDSERLALKPANVEAQLDLSFDLTVTGNIYYLKHDLRKSLDGYVRAQEIRRKLSDGDPADVRKRRTVLRGEYRIGEVLLDLEDVRGALAHYQTAVAIGVEMLRQHPSEPNLARDLALVYTGLAVASRRLGRHGEACSWWHRAIALDSALAADSAARLRACPGG